MYFSFTELSFNFHLANRFDKFVNNFLRAHYLYANSTSFSLHFQFCKKSSFAWPIINANGRWKFSKRTIFVLRLLTFNNRIICVHLWKMRKLNTAMATRRLRSWLGLVWREAEEQRNHSHFIILAKNLSLFITKLCCSFISKKSTQKILSHSQRQEKVIYPNWY